MLCCYRLGSVRRASHSTCARPCFVPAAAADLYYRNGSAAIGSVNHAAITTTGIDRLATTRIASRSRSSQVIGYASFARITISQAVWFATQIGAERGSRCNRP